MVPVDPVLSIQQFQRLSQDRDHACRLRMLVCGRFDPVLLNDTQQLAYHGDLQLIERVDLAVSHLLINRQEVRIRV